MKTLTFSLFLVLFQIAPGSLVGQIPFNTSVSNEIVDDILKGDYDPLNYSQSEPFENADLIACDLFERINRDSLFSYIILQSDFGTRNTYSDTISAIRGIGASRRWVFNKFNSFSIANEGRLQVSYMDFEVDSNAVCGQGEFRNIFAILPGTDPELEDILLIEGHIDSRCEVLCDTSCLAPGAEDNASGTAIVLELARTMSAYSFKRSVVFLVTVGEEQGLLGARAFSDYAESNGIQIKAVQNNDIVGGVVCGETSSPPSCSGEGDVDSTALRIFSYGVFNSPHKSFARYVKMINEEKIKDLEDVPMEVRLMNAEDRSGRGGDHIPFRQNGYTAVRFSAANEHGNADTENPDYVDRQHTSRDVPGEDFDSNGAYDTLYIDINYLRRNTRINGLSLVMAANSPEAPLLNVSIVGDEVIASVTDPSGNSNFRIGIRKVYPDFTAVYSFSGPEFSIPGLVPSTLYRFSAASVDENNIMSFFSNEVTLSNTLATTAMSDDTVRYFPLSCSFTGSDENFGYDINNDWICNALPNPFNNTVILKIYNPLQTSTELIVSVEDLNGRNLYREKILSSRGSRSYPIYLDGLLPGVYFLHVEDGNSLYKTLKILSF